MNQNELSVFENRLIDKGYKKIYSAKYDPDDDYEYYIPVRDPETGDLKYQIFFEFWNFEKYKTDAGWSVSLTIMPESVSGLGRRDLNISADWITDIEKVELLAMQFYNFINQF